MGNLKRQSNRKKSVKEDSRSSLRNKDKNAISFKEVSTQELQERRIACYPYMM